MFFCNALLKNHWFIIFNQKLSEQERNGDIQYHQNKTKNSTPLLGKVMITLSSDYKSKILEHYMLRGSLMNSNHHIVTSFISI